MAQSREFPAFISVEYSRDAAGFPAFERDAQATADRARRFFDDAYREIGNIAKSALAMPRNALGSLDIDANGYRQAAQAAQAQAIALREVAVAADRAARANGDSSEETRLYVQAARAAATEAESNARAANQQAVAMERLQTELNQTRSATTELISAEQRRDAALIGGVDGVRAMRFASIQLGQQLQDVTVSLAGGQNAIVVFAQQVPQAALALIGFGGRLGKIAEFLSGPWGAAIFAATTVLGLLATSALKGGDAMRSQANAAADLEKAINELNEASGKEIQTQQQAAVAAFNAAVALREQEIRVRNLTKAKLDDALAEYQAQKIRAQAPGQRGDIAALGLQTDLGQVNALQDALARQDKAIAAAQQAIRNKSIAVIDAQVKANLDPLAKAQATFERTQGALRKAYSEGKIGAREYEIELANAQRTLDATTTSVREADRSTRSHGAANREAAAAIREAERAQRELDSALANIVQRFDPARAAAQAYADTLSDIARLQSSGRLTADQAFLYGADAARQYANDNEERRQQQARDFYKSIGVDAAESMREQIEGGERLRDAARGIGEAGGAAFRQSGEAAARDIANLFGAQIRGGLGGILALLSAPRGSLSQYDLGRADFLRPLREVADSITRTFSKGGSFDRILGSLVTGAQIGQFAGSTILGSGGSGTGSAIGGALGGALGKAVGPAIGKALGGTLGNVLGSAAGPIGSIAGGLLGGAIGGLFSKPKYGTAAISLDGTGGLTSSLISGRGSSNKAAASATAASVADAIEQIAEQFGATITGTPNITIGTYKDKYRVSTTGYQGKLDFKGQSAVGLYNFDQDQEAAIKFAIQESLSRSVISGIRESTARILQSGDDLNRAIEKATQFEAVFTRLQEYTDPAAAALASVNKEFSNLKTIFEQAGASAEEYADLEELYGKERAKAIKEATEQMTSSLQGLIDDLTVNNETRSLRERLAAAQAAYNPLAEQARAGTLDPEDTDAFTDAARTLLDIQRQLYGSQAEYFAQESSILDLTKKVLDDRTALINAATGSTTPFDSTTSTTSTTQPVVSALDQLGSTLVTNLGGTLTAINDNIARLLKQAQATNSNNAALNAAVARLNF